MPPPIDIPQNSKRPKYIQSYEEPLEESFKIAAQISGFQTQPNPYSIMDVPQFLPLCITDEERLGISNFHPICCKVNRLIDAGVERKQIEKYISGRAQHTIYVT